MSRIFQRALFPAKREIGSGDSPGRHPRRKIFYEEGDQPFWRAGNEKSEFGIASGYAGMPGYIRPCIFVHAHASHGYTKQVYPRILSLGE